ncbi:MAG: ABC transporter permease [Actinomycetia bacterium]|nr:ABC transporter permease [Actinomycetes bacterium]
MHILHQASLQSLREMRSRTLATIVGIVLSVALITAVLTSVSSFQNYLVQSQIEAAGNWQVRLTGVSFAVLDDLRSDDRVAATAEVQHVGYGLLNQGQTDQASLFVVGLNDEAFGSLPVRIVAGRLPENNHEIVIPGLLSVGNENSKSSALKIGAEVNLVLGEYPNDAQLPAQGQASNSGTIVTASKASAFSTPIHQESYTVVGICNSIDLGGSPYSDFTLITKTNITATAGVNGADSTDSPAVFDAYVRLKSPSQAAAFAQGLDAAYTPELNSVLLELMGLSDNNSSSYVLIYLLEAVLIALIMACSILLIYNAFAISFSERSRQFGILASVGATKRQLMATAVFEGLCLGAVGIPIGLMVGAVGIGATLSFVGIMFKQMTGIDATLSPHLSAPAILVAIAASIITVLASAYIPARKAFQTSIIDAIRQSDDIKISARSVRSPKLVQKIFGLDGTLALKGFKRNKRRYRSTVLSLSISVVLFVSAAAYGMHLNSAANAPSSYGFDLALMPQQARDSSGNVRMLQLFANLKQTDQVYQGTYISAISCTASIPSDYLSQGYPRLQGLVNGSEAGSSVPVTLLFLDDTSYQGYLTCLGLPVDEYRPEQGMLLAWVAGGVASSNDKPSNGDSIRNDKQDALQINLSIDSANGTTVHRALACTVVDQPPELGLVAQFGGLMAFAPYSSMAFFGKTVQNSASVYMAFLSHDPTKSEAAMRLIIKEAGLSSSYVLRSSADTGMQIRNATLILNVFSHGFVIMIGLISTANVFNTLSTSVKLRRREFAMLRSMGMDNRMFNRMVSLECLVYGLKALAWGLPASVLASFLIHRAMGNATSTLFMLPWVGIAISVFSVFTVVFATMLYATSKLKQTNVIEVLRNDTA